MEELIDVYDENLNPLGITVPREGAFMQEGQFMLYVLAVIENMDGKILITQRSMEKGYAAGWWEVGGGGAQAGESPLQAIVREVSEEVGLKVTEDQPELIHSYTSIDLKRGDNYITKIFKIKTDFAESDVVLQDGEAVDFKLVTWDEIEKLNEEGIFLHYKRLKTALGK